jgi:hypothetical protein
MLDFSTANEQRDFEVIPDGTTAIVALKIRPGSAGEDGILKRTKKGDAEGLDIELTIVGGKYDKRKFWTFEIVSGTTDGHAQMVDRTRERLRAILESVRGIKPADVSEAAKKARSIEGYGDLDGLRFMCKISVDPAKDGYKAKNTLDRVITPDRPEWQPVEQVTKPAPASAPDGEKPSNVIVKPVWAQ